MVSNPTSIIFPSFKSPPRWILDISTKVHFENVDLELN
jgi:hypothetical protein